MRLVVKSRALPVYKKIRISSLLCIFETILRKTIEGYLGLVPSLTFNTIKTKLIMITFHSSIYLKSKWMLDFCHASMV